MSGWDRMVSVSVGCQPQALGHPDPLPPLTFLSRALGTPVASPLGHVALSFPPHPLPSSPTRARVRLPTPDYQGLCLTESLRLPSEVGISFHFHFMCEEAECREMGPRHTSPVFPGYGTSLGLQGRIQSKVVCPQGWEAAHL